MNNIKNNLLKFFVLILMINTYLYSNETIWLHDYEQAIAKAKKEHKDVYLFIGADRCKFCKKYKEETLSDTAVMKRLAKDYVPVYLSRDQHLIPENYETDGVPRHYFIQANEKAYFSTRGLLEIDGFYTMLDEAELSKE